MPKPTQAVLMDLFDDWRRKSSCYVTHAPEPGSETPLDLAHRLNVIWSEAWDKDRAEMMQPYATNTDSVKVWLRDGDGGGDGGSGDTDAYNDLQRARREGLLYAWTHFMDGKEIPSHSRRYRRPELMAKIAKVYPLRKRVPRVVKDVHGADGAEWSIEDGSGRLRYRRMPDCGWATQPGMTFTPERVHLLSDLLSNPYEWVEDTEPETDPNSAPGV